MINKIKNLVWRWKFSLTSLIFVLAVYNFVNVIDSSLQALGLLVIALLSFSLTAYEFWKNIKKDK